MENKSKLNKVMLIVFILALFVGLVTLFIIINKGNIFGKRLVEISGEVVEKEITHSIEMTCDKKYLAIDTEDVANLLVTIDGVDMQDGFEYSISDETLVTIENNVVKPTGEEGTVIIKAKSIDYGIEAETTIEIVKPITKLYVQSEYSSIDIGEQMQLEYTFKPSTATPVVEYSISDESIATIDDSGIVTGVSSGTVTLTATDTITGIGASCKLKISSNVQQ